MGNGNTNEQELMETLVDSVKETQKSNQLLAETLSRICIAAQTAPAVLSEQDNTHLQAYMSLSEKTAAEKGAAPKTDAEKIKAVYALNIITVSVAQIVKYNDLNFMELEYETILNNLNLEQFPKDEELLSIIKQILNVISFFRIQEKERALLEKKYNQRIKDCIWSAVPNFGLMLGSIFGGNPIGKTISFVAAVGTSYMNYRREKASVLLDKEEDEFKLQRSAAEQLSGLQRELFDTAWRLSAKYEYDDILRLTSRQIDRYNTVLMDEDPVRRYERMLIMKEEFEAYPPFWYYLGNAANLSFSSTNDQSYKECAINYYKKYMDFVKENDLFREDHIAASCALEYYDLLPNDEKLKQKELLLTAEKKSGRSMDTLQLCAFEYMKIKDNKNACRLLKELVNEGYNLDVNAKLLGGLYCMIALEIGHENDYIQKDYNNLERLVPDMELLPMPQKEYSIESYEMLCDKKISSLRSTLAKEYLYVIKRIYIRYEKRWSFVVNLKSDAYKEVKCLLTELIAEVKGLLELGEINIFEDKLRSAIQENKQLFEELEKSNHFSSKNTVTFYKLTRIAFYSLGKELNNRFKGFDSLSKIESDRIRLISFCNEKGLYRVDVSEKVLSDDIADKVLEYRHEKKVKLSHLREEMLSIIKKDATKIIAKCDDDHTFMYMGTDEFKNAVSRQKNIDLNVTVAVMKNQKEQYFFTIEGIVKNGVLIPYGDFLLGKQPGQLMNKRNNLKFDINIFDVKKLYELIDTLGQKAGNVLDEPESEDCKSMFSRLMTAIDRKLIDIGEYNIVPVTSTEQKA